MHALIHVFLQLFYKFPRAAVAVSLLVSVMLSILTFVAWNEMRSLPDSPEELTLEQVASRATAGSRVWARVTDQVEWDCGTLIHYEVGNGLRTDVALSSHDGSILVLATFTEEVSCRQAESSPPIGVFYAMSERRKTVLAEKGFPFGKYPVATDLLALCVVCGRGNSAALAIVFGVLAFAAALLYPLALIVRRDPESKASKELNTDYARN